MGQALNVDASVIIWRQLARRDADLTVIPDLDQIVAARRRMVSVIPNRAWRA